MKPLNRQRLDKTRPHLRRDDEETIRLAMIRGELGEELVVRDARRRCQLCLGADFGLDPFGDLCCGCDALKILSHIEIGFVERQRLDDGSVLSEYRPDL
jgi:hypothetical protein